MYDKTVKGRDEIATRKHHLAPRLRTMLLLFDGKNTAEQVLQKVAGLGLDASAIQELLQHEFIHESVSEAAAAVIDTPTAPVTVNESPPPDAVLDSVTSATAATLASPPLPANDTIASPIVEAPVISAPPVVTAPPVGTTVSETQTQFQSVYNFFTETIKKTIGLRGFTLQLKVERASTIDDFRALRDQYIAAVLNAHGPDVARDIGARLDALLQPRG